jgi:trimeric autotransporter adhesin
MRAPFCGSDFFGRFPAPRELEGGSRIQQGNFQPNKIKKMKFKVRSISRSPSRCGFFILAVALCWFVLSPALKAGCPNPPGVCGGQNTAVGEDALFNITTGVWNVGVGVKALFNDTIGNQNTAVGYQTLFNNIDGDKSTGIGSQVLFSNTTGNENVGVGFRTLYLNTMGNRNTGMGYRTLAFSDTGNDNTAVGWNALYNNRMGAGDNTAVGSRALLHNLTGSDNVAVGFRALEASTSGAVNTAVGSLALNTNTTGTENTAVGRRALQNLDGGHENTAVGWGAGANYTGTEFKNICIGDGVGGNVGESEAIRIGDNLPSGGIDIISAAGFNLIDIGHSFSSGGISILRSFVGASIQIGALLPTVNGASHCFIGGIYNQTPVGVSHVVVVDSNNRLTDGFISSRRFKKDIAPIDKLSEGILALKPVTFHFKNDDTNYPQFGLIAEDVAEVNPDWITRDPQGEIHGVRYDTIPVLLLNEFLKEHKKVEEQQASIAELKNEVQTMVAQLKEQAAQIQKVTAQLEVTKPAPQVVTNKP